MSQSSENTKVILRLNAGVLTRRISIPKDCVATSYRLPIRKAHVGLIRAMNELPSGIPFLEFRWDRRSSEGSDHCPIMDLVEVPNV
jgi:hypothetical protein